MIGFRKKSLPAIAWQACREWNDQCSCVGCSMYFPVAAGVEQGTLITRAANLRIGLGSTTGFGQERPLAIGKYDPSSYRLSTQFNHLFWQFVLKRDEDQ